MLAMRLVGDFEELVQGKDVEVVDEFDDLLKGDFVGHPFRGNQYADSSGASRGGASQAVRGVTGSLPSNGADFNPYSAESYDYSEMDRRNERIERSANMSIAMDDVRHADLGMMHDMRGGVIIESTLPDGRKLFHNAIRLTGQVTSYSNEFARNHHTPEAAEKMRAKFVAKFEEMLAAPDLVITAVDGDIWEYKYTVASGIYKGRTVTTRSRFKAKSGMGDPFTVVSDAPPVPMPPFPVVKFNPTVMFKGDFVGHPFRGNQYADASGASRGAPSGDQVAVASPSMNSSTHYLGSAFRAGFNDVDFQFDVDESGMVMFLHEQQGHLRYARDVQMGMADYLSELYFEDINKYLRLEASDKGSGETYVQGLQDANPSEARIKYSVESMDKALQGASFDRDVVVFRGVEDDLVSRVDGNLATVQVGDVVADAGFQSTSLNPMIASSFSEKSSMGGGKRDETVVAVILKLTIPKGRPALAVESAVGMYKDIAKKNGIYDTDQADELGVAGYTLGVEIVVPRGAAFTVTGRSVVDGTIVIEGKYDA